MVVKIVNKPIPANKSDNASTKENVANIIAFLDQFPISKQRLGNIIE